MSETRTYQGHTYTRNGPGDPWTMVGPTAGGIIYDPSKTRDEARKDQSQQLDVERFDQTAANNARERGRTNLQNAQDLRQEYEKLPEVQAYRTMLSVATKATSTAPGPQGDLSLTYAYSKAMDPTSSVREGEQASVAGTQPGLQAVVEKIKKQFGVDGAGNFTPQARAALRMEIFRAASAMKPLYDRARADMEDHSRAVGVDPKEVIGRDDTATYAPLFRAYGEKEGDDGTISRIIGGEPIKGSGLDYQKPAPAEAAGQGATKEGLPIPEEMQKEYFTYLNQNWGKLDPSGFSAFRINLDRKYGLGGGQADYRSDAVKMNEIALKGQGPNVVGRIPPQERTMGVDRALNDLVSSPVGTGVATGANMIGYSLPSRFAGDQFSSLRTLNPKSALLGDVAGGTIGAMTGGAALKAGSAALGAGSGLARVLANPLTADLGYGGIVGANDAAGRGENQLLGGLFGAGGGFLGNKLGGAIGRAFPRSVGAGGAIKKLDANVPTSDDLKTLASGLYGHMEANGLTASPADTLALADSTKKILADAGEITPKDKLAAAPGATSKAYNLISDFADEPMDPNQYQTVRKVISDALDSPEPSDRRVAKDLLENFDTWTEATNPAMNETWKDARNVSSRYIQGDALVDAGKKAGVRAGQYTQSGMDNALRVDYRQIARDIVGNKEHFYPALEGQINTVTKGTPLNNGLRALGSLAPVSPSGIRNGVGTMMGAGGLGAVSGAGGGTGALLGGGLIGTSLLARQLSQSLTKRGAKVAENMAYGGPEYADALQTLIANAGARGGDIGTGMTAGAVPYENDAVARLLRARNGAY